MNTYHTYAIITAATAASASNIDNNNNNNSSGGGDGNGNDGSSGGGGGGCQENTRSNHILIILLNGLKSNLHTRAYMSGHTLIEHIQMYIEFLDQALTFAHNCTTFNVVYPC